MLQIDVNSKFLYIFILLLNKFFKNLGLELYRSEKTIYRNFGLFESLCIEKLALSYYLSGQKKIPQMSFKSIYSIRNSNSRTQCLFRPYLMLMHLEYFVYLKHAKHNNGPNLKNKRASFRYRMAITVHGSCHFKSQFMACLSTLFKICGHLNPSIQRNKLLSAEVPTRGVKFEFSKISIFIVFSFQNRSVPAYLFSRNNIILNVF